MFISVFGDIVVYYYSHVLDLYGDADETKDDQKKDTKNKEEGGEEAEMHPLNKRRESRLKEEENGGRRLSVPTDVIINQARRDSIDPSMVDAIP